MFPPGIVTWPSDLLRRLHRSRPTAWILLAFLAAALALLVLPATAFPQVKVACIGDSITAGAGLPDPDTQSYPAVLGTLLGDGFQVRNYGVSGTTMLHDGDHPYWDTSAFADSTAWEPDIVIIMLGTNDSKPWNWVYGHEYRSDYLEMVAHYAGLPSAPAVFVCTPCPVYGDNPYGITAAVVADLVVPLVWLVGAEADVPVIDVFTGLSGVPEDFPDNVHPNVAGAALLAYTIWEGLVSN